MTTPIKSGEWHTVVVEIRGSELLARLDGDKVAFGSDPAIDMEKTNYGLTVAGETVSFKNFRVWEATPNSSWEATKANWPKAPAAN